MKKIKKIYFQGIKGVGMVPLAIIAKQSGLDIDGSDTVEEFITDEILKKENVSFHTGFDVKNFRDFIAGSDKQDVLVVITSAHQGFDNDIARFASSQGIETITQGKAVGVFMDGAIIDRKFEGISVAGCHGKTTISAMLATYLSFLNFDPTYVVGTSELFPLGLSGHYGGGDYFVSEADEYASELVYDRTPKFLYQHPKFAIINNIDFDHPDFFRNIDDVEDVFFSFSQQVKRDGFVVANGDDTRIISLKKKIGGGQVVITFGSSESSDFCITHYSQDGFKSFFSVERKGILLGEFNLNVPGIHNAKNALACIALLVELGISVKKIQEVFPRFLGTKRRMEIVGKTNSKSLIIDDYAHHPQEVKTTLFAIKKALPDKKIICVFQPHTYSRTKAFVADFTAAFTETSHLILLPIYASMREEAVDNSKLEDQLVESIRSIHKEVVFIKEPEFVVEYLNNNFKDDRFVIVTMGAGDVYKISEKLSVRQAQDNPEPIEGLKVKS